MKKVNLENFSHKIQEVHDEYPRKHGVPKSIHKKDLLWIYYKDCFNKYDATRVYHLKNCFVSMNGTIRNDDGRVFLDSTMYPLDVKPSKFDMLDNAFVLAQHWGGSNYYHWMFNAVPRYGILLDSGVELKGSALVNNNKRKYEVVFSNKIKNEVIPLQGKHYLCKNLIVPSMINKPPHPTVYSCNFIKDFFKEHSSKVNGRRIYSTRTSRRIVVNEKDIISLLKKKGFEIIDNDKLTFEEQIKTYSEADYVIGPHGANLSNLVFCKKGTKILEMFNPSFFGLVYWFISDINKLDYYVLLGKGKRSKSKQDYDYRGNCYKNIEIDLYEFQHTLEMMNL